MEEMIPGEIFDGIIGVGVLQESRKTSVDAFCAYRSGVFQSTNKHKP